MRKLMTIVAALGCALALAACGSQNDDQKTDQPAATGTAGQQAPSAPRRTAEATRPAAATAAAPTPVQIAQCKRDGLAADNRTEAQARDLQVGAEVTINGTRQRLAAGQSYWSLCSGPSTEARLASVTAERDQWRAYAVRLEPLAMVNPQQGLDARGNTWVGQYRRVDGLNTTMTADLAKAQKDARVYGVLLFLAIVVIIGMAFLWFMTSRRRQKGPVNLTGRHSSAPLDTYDDPDTTTQPAR